MTRKQIEYYHKEVTDQEGNTLKVGDIVVFPDSYARSVHIGIIHHFAEYTVVLKYAYTGFKGKVIPVHRQARANRIIKIGHCNDIYKPYKEFLDDYGKELCNSQNSFTQYNDLSTSKTLVDEAL